MSLNCNENLSPSGARRISPAMLDAKAKADAFVGVPAGMAKPFAYLAAFQEAEPYLGLPPHAFKLVAWLVKQTMPCDWEAGSRPIVWPSARHQQEYLVLSPARVKMLNRTLFEAGIFVIRDNEQGKRYGRRGPDKRIIEAYGFDLSPLAQRCEEFIRIAAEARAERLRVKALRQRITRARRAIAQAGETLAALETSLPAGWPQLAHETVELVADARQAARSEDLAGFAAALERRQMEAERWVREAAPAVENSCRVSSESVESDPTGLVHKPHITDTNLKPDLSDTVIAAEESKRGASSSHTAPRRSVSGIKQPEQLIELFPRLAAHIWAPEPGWREIIDAAGGGLRQELGISPSLWVEACREMGREGAALALAIVSAKPLTHFTQSPGGYFGGMVRKAQKGELYLDRTLWALREMKWGKRPSRSLN